MKPSTAASDSRCSRTEPIRRNGGVTTPGIARRRRLRTVAARLPLPRDPAAGWRRCGRSRRGHRWRGHRCGALSAGAWAGRRGRRRAPSHHGRLHRGRRWRRHRRRRAGGLRARHRFGRPAPRRAGGGPDMGATVVDGGPQASAGSPDAPRVGGTATRLAAPSGAGSAAASAAARRPCAARPRRSGTGYPLRARAASPATAAASRRRRPPGSSPRPPPWPPADGTAVVIRDRRRSLWAESPAWSDTAGSRAGRGASHGDVPAVAVPTREGRSAGRSTRRGRCGAAASGRTWTPEAARPRGRRSGIRPARPHERRAGAAPGRRATPLGTVDQVATAPAAAQ